MAAPAFMALLIFILVYLLIISEKVHRTKVALIGAVLVILVKILPQEEAVRAVDFNTLGLLIGMMILVTISRRTGVFQYIAVKAAKLVQGNPARILVAFFAITAIASAFLDNVTTVLLLTSITFAITEVLDMNPIPFLVSEIIASNIGGTATLIGDPPNIMIGGATGLGFVDFIANLTLPIILVGIVNCFLLYLIFKKDLTVSREMQLKILELDERAFLTDRRLLIKSLAVLAAVMAGFLLHQTLHLESATIAMAGAAVLLLVSGFEPEEVFQEVEWNTIFFFIGLFILVGALEVTGIIKMIAQWGLDITKGNIVFMNFLILWLSALASAFIDNIPFVATMIPLIKSMAQLGGIDVSSLWWTLSLGACLGGNGTIIGASANVVVSSIAAAHGRPISFAYYFRIAFPLMIISIAIVNLYVYLVYLQ
ncbi:arsenical pump membrane protein arsb [Lucifera butyrica]|uniref:Arsenical pump membrane protein arsb n=1 Tax=Lucifera butyrica TaxID=1351585 RepID=A0A498R9L0_9FIRM|nr:ArsB/NhaD family transporter [Lucifera butyrica]VBB07849.1 arsenical pump membrane protein arsb [Lucifera butyrica]